MTKPTKWHVRPAKTQISLGIRPVWSEPSLCAQWVAKNLSFLHPDCQDSDQTGRLPRLIWVFAGRTRHFVGFVMHWLSYYIFVRFFLAQTVCIYVLHISFKLSIKERMKELESSRNNNNNNNNNKTMQLLVLFGWDFQRCKKDNRVWNV